MFCHDRYSLLFVFENKQHDHINTRKETMGETRGRRESRSGHRLHNDRTCDAATVEKMASICHWCGLSGNIGDAFAAVPGLTSLCRVLLHISLAPSRCLRSHYPPSRAGEARGAVEQESGASRIPGIERLSAHA